MLFFRQILLQGCFIECEILQTPLISYRSLLFIATAMNDTLRNTALLMRDSCKVYGRFYLIVCHGFVDSNLHDSTKDTITLVYHLINPLTRTFFLKVICNGKSTYSYYVDY